MIDNSWNIYWFQQIYQKSDDVFCRVYGVFRRVCGSFTRPSIFSGIWKAQNMPGLSLPSRIYSSSTLMDGEALVSEQAIRRLGVKTNCCKNWPNWRPILNKNRWISRVISIFASSNYSVFDVINTSHDCTEHPIANRHAISMMINNVLLLHRQERIEPAQPKLFLIPTIPRMPFVCRYRFCLLLNDEFKLFFFDMF